MHFLMLYFHIQNICTQQTKLKHHHVFSFESLKERMQGAIGKRCCFHKIHCLFFSLLLFIGMFICFSSILHAILVSFLMKFWLSWRSIESSWLLLGDTKGKFLTWNPRIRAMKFQINRISFCSSACCISFTLLCYSSKSAGWISLSVMKIHSFSICY